MKTCAYCGRENRDETTRCWECGTSEFNAAASQSPGQQQKDEAEPELPEMESDVPPDGESSLCTACLFPNLPEVTWCKRCGAPVGPTTSIVPTDAAESVGYVYRGALRGRPKKVVLLGVWVLFFPGFILNLFFILTVLSSVMGGGGGLIGLWLALGFEAICSMMLYRVTRNYLKIPARADDTDRNEEPVHNSTEG